MKIECLICQKKCHEGPCVCSPLNAMLPDGWLNLLGSDGFGFMPICSERCKETYERETPKIKCPLLRPLPPINVVPFEVELDPFTLPPKGSGIITYDPQRIFRLHEINLSIEISDKIINPRLQEEECIRLATSLYFDKILFGKYDALAASVPTLLVVAGHVDFPTLNVAEILRFHMSNMNSEQVKFKLKLSGPSIPPEPKRVRNSRIES